MIIKRFNEWIGLKEKLHEKQHKEPYVSEGDIWWASVGENIGYEMNGKSEKFSRPVIIYKKLARGFYCVIPTTTQLKTGSWFVHFKQHGEDRTACLHQIRTIDYRRLWSKVGELDDSDMERVKTGFEICTHKKIPPEDRGSRENPESTYIIDLTVSQSKKIDEFV